MTRLELLAVAVVWAWLASCLVVAMLLVVAIALGPHAPPVPFRVAAKLTLWGTVFIFAVALLENL